MRFPGLVLPRKMNKTKNSHKSPENSGFQPARPVYPRLHKTHTATVLKIRGTGTLRYGVAENIKVYKQHFNPDISVDTNSDTILTPFLTPT